MLEEVRTGGRERKRERERRRREGVDKGKRGGGGRVGDRLIHKDIGNV